MTLCGAKSYEIRVQTGKGVESSANKFQFPEVQKFFDSEILFIFPEP